MEKMDFCSIYPKTEKDEKGNVKIVNSSTYGIYTSTNKPVIEGNGVKNENKVARMNYVKEVLEANNLVFIEKLYGHLVIDGISIWATTEKWYDPFTNKKGKGINSFLNHLHFLGYVK